MMDGKPAEIYVGERGEERMKQASTWEREEKRE
jgi:hypothetical protein